MRLELGTAIDRYVVEGLIGQGGVASVYRVRHAGLGTVHALKVVHVPSPMVMERLLREGRIQGRLRHPNVVSVTDLVAVRGAPGLVMEYVPGPSLAVFLDHQVLDLEQADSIARQIIAGVAAAHRIGLVHRDLKPGNVLVDVADGQIVPKIVDFGLAKVLEAPDDSPIATRQGASLGTPAYMAPEQIGDASSVDERADVFALGAMLFELVAGRRAFEGVTVRDVQGRILAGQHEPLPDGLPRRMRDTLEAALSVDLASRVQSVEALQRAWCADTTAPSPVWAIDTLAWARMASDAPEIPSAGSTSTFGDGVRTRTTQETWAEDPDGASTTLADGNPGRRVERRAGGWLAGALSIALVGAGMAWFGSRTAPLGDRELSPDVVPMVSARAEVQKQFAGAAEAWFDGDQMEVERRLRSVRAAEPDQCLPHLLASDALFSMGDVPGGLEAMKQARAVVAMGLDGPGCGLVRVLDALVDRGASVGPELDQYLDAHPDDLLAHVLNAKYCATTSSHEVCELAHKRLTDRWPEQPISWVAVARSWSDLGVPSRVREAVARGLELDPSLPSLLDLQGRTWLAEGDVEKAREAARAALVADPRIRGPKMALAQAALLADDGSWDTVTEELLAPTVPAAERVLVHIEAVQTLLGMGQAERAHRAVDEAVAIERAEGTSLGVLAAMSQRSEILGLEEDTAGLVALVEAELTLVAGSPEIPNPVRNRYASYLPMARALDAAAKGDREALVEGLEQVSGAEVQQRHVVERLQRELGVMDANEAAIRAATSQFWTDCARNATLGSAFRRAGLHDQAMGAHRAVLQSHCALHRAERAYVVAAHLGLAEFAAAASDEDALAAHLGSIDHLWRSPDPHLPLVRRLQALRDAP